MDYKELKKKQDILDDISKQLKKEFIGIDNVIDNINNSIISWYCFPEIMKRPLVINLWGMTGIGKTSLIRRLVELLEYSEKYFHFDTNSYGNGSATFEDIYNVCRGQPFVLTLDEFQLARTIDEEKKEQINNSLKHIWDILDSGKFSIIRFNEYVSWLFFLIERLQRTLSSGFKVKDGKVIGSYIDFCNMKNSKSGEKDYYGNSIGYDNYDFSNIKIDDTTKQFIMKNIDDDDEEYDSEDISFLEKKLFVNDYEVNYIYKVVDHLNVTKAQFCEKFLTMNGYETIDFLKDVYKHCLKPKVVDCSKALIFVIGNLDEVYTMAKNFNPDINADEFNELSLKITLPDVKNALLRRFRSEQISRLGNNHIIYPSFKEKDFYAIIDIELNKIRDEVKKLYNIDVNFNENIAKLIYKEGVFPTQGCRPVFSTIYEIVQARLGKIFVQLFSKSKTQTNTINFEVSDENLRTLSKEITIDIICYNDKKKKEVVKFEEKVPLKLAKLVESTKDDQQAITAVHEAGHCICEIVLKKSIPSQVVSVTSDTFSSGFTYTRDDYEYMSKDMVINEIAVMFGGIVAEEIIFGNDYITNGSCNDITTASSYAQNFITQYGFGDYPVSLAYEEVLSLNDGFVKREEHLNLLKKCKGIAMKTLMSQMDLLMAISKYLADNSSINNDNIIKFIKKHGKDIDIKVLQNSKKNIYYRKKLMGKI